MAAAARDSSAVVEKPTKKEVVVEVAGPSRREFLYYIWGASMVMLLGESTVGLIWFALPRFKEGEFGGTFNFTVENLPEAGAAPYHEAAGRFWVVNLPAGQVLTLYGVCTHLGCLPKWVPGNDRFECPCHGSKYRMNGTWIEGPAPRGLDRFSTTVAFTNGEEVVATTTEPIALNGREIASIRINTGEKITGPAHGITQL